MKVEESLFRTWHRGMPVPRDVLRHNAYTAGWEHGAADHRAPGAYWKMMWALGLGAIYSEGIEDGRRARKSAFEKAAKLRADEEDTDA